MKLVALLGLGLLVQEPPAERPSAQDLLGAARSRAKETQKLVFLTLGSPG